MDAGPSYLDRLESSLVETALLAELRPGPLAEDQLVGRVGAMGAFGPHVHEAFIRRCLARLSAEKRVGRRCGAWDLTPRGREGVARAEGVLCCVAAAQVRGVSVPDAYVPQARHGRVREPAP